MEPRFRLAVDVGGTFTDGIVINESTGEIHYIKVPSTPADPSDGFLKNLEMMIKSYEVNVDNVWLSSPNAQY